MKQFIFMAKLHGCLIAEKSVSWGDISQSDSGGLQQSVLVLVKS